MRILRGSLPEVGRQTISRNDAVRIDEQASQKCALARAAERQNAAVRDSLDRAEDGEVHMRSPKRR